MWIHQIALLFILIFCKVSCFAQAGWATPELEHMYRNVQDYKKMGNTKDAITTLRQLILLVPDKINLKTELGNLYYLAGDYTQGEDVLLPLVKEPTATDTTYQLLAACQLALVRNKQAKNTIKKGLALYPKSGLLHYRNGLLCMQDKNEDEAIHAWQEGISQCPAEPINYLAYAKTALNGNDILWGLIYGEMYLAMTTDTTGTDSLKLNIYNGWQTFFRELADPKKQTEKQGPTHEIYTIYRELTPVISDGITTENLTMVRTRFLMKMNRANNMKLFTYQDKLIREGWFDIYNEWLFGKAEHSGLYAAWTKFHAGDIEKFEQWRGANLLQP